MDMCIICTGLRPWTPSCGYQTLARAAQGLDGGPAGGLDGLRLVQASAAPPTLSPSEIGDKLLTDSWNSSAPRRFDAQAGDTLTVDVSALTEDGRRLARAALDEWSTVTGLAFREVEGGFRPTAVRQEAGDAAASRATGADLSSGEAFVGRVGSGDRDWVRLDLPGSATAKIALEGWGSEALRRPGLALFDATGRQIPIGIQYSGSSAEVAVATTGGGGTYYAQVSGIGGAVGGYRLSLAEPGGATGARIAFDDDRPGAQAEFALSGGRILSAEVNVSTGWLEEHGTGTASYGFQTYLHEIGHALGLGHPGDYGRRASFDEAEYRNDSWQTSVMSYFSQTENPHVKADKAYVVTPMIGDVEAMRALYGATAVRAGNTVYGEGSNAGGTLERVAFLPEAVTFTILDTGGTDLVNLASQRADQRLDLRSGGVSDVLGHKGNMVIALRTVIEHAVLGSGDDTVIGNDAGNAIRGGAGHDTLHGHGGRDVLAGEAGRDRLDGGAGDDRLWGGDGTDLLNGRGGSDVLGGGGGGDVLRGGGGADDLSGGTGADRLYGEGGADDLRGGTGDDRLDGGSGRDRLDGGRGSDVLAGGAGADVFIFEGRFGRDRVMDFKTADRDRIDLSEVGGIRSYHDLLDDHLRQRTSDVVIDAGDAGRIVLHDVAARTLDADDFLF